MDIDPRVYDEVFFSVDGEFDGTHPPRHSMLQVGACAFTLRDGIIGEFERSIFALNRATEHFESNETKERRSAWLQSIGLPTGHTMDRRVWDEFWSKQPKAWEAVNDDRVVPAVAMNDFRIFYERMTVNPRSGVLIEYPGGIDYFWIHWYFMEYLGEDPFGHSRAMSMKSYAAAVIKGPFCHATNRNLPKRWSRPKMPHLHTALADARGQAHWAIRMMCENLDIASPID